MSAAASLGSILFGMSKVVFHKWMHLGSEEPNIVAGGLLVGLINTNVLSIRSCLRFVVRGGEGESAVRIGAIMGLVVCGYAEEEVSELLTEVIHDDTALWSCCICGSFKLGLFLWNLS